MAENEFDYSQPPADKAELLARIEREWRVLDGTICCLSEDEMNTPGPDGWSIKDNIAHVSEWNRYLLSVVLGGQPAAEVFGISADTFSGMDDDSINDILFQRHKDRPAGEVLDTFHRTHERVVAALEAVPFEDLLKPGNPTEVGSGQVLDYVAGNTYGHYIEHRINITRLIAGT